MPKKSTTLKHQEHDKAGWERFIHGTLWSLVPGQIVEMLTEKDKLQYLVQCECDLYELCPIFGLYILNTYFPCLSVSPK